MFMKRFLIALCLLSIALLLSSCDASITPIEKNNGEFSIYGFLDLNRPGNVIRIRDLDAPYTRDATEQFNATVTLENLSSNFKEELRSDTAYFHDLLHYNFIAIQDIEPDTEYRLEVKRPNGKKFTKKIISPTRQDPAIAPQNQDCNTPVTISFDSLSRGTIILELAVSYGGELRWSEHIVLRAPSGDSKMVSYSFIPTELLVYAIENGVRASRCIELSSNIITLRATHYSPGFYDLIFGEEFDVYENSKMFGSLYSETYEFPIILSQ
jgi:hypothetical protein